MDIDLEKPRLETMTDRLTTLQVTKRYGWSSQKMSDVARFVPSLAMKERPSEALRSLVITWDHRQMDVMKVLTETFGMTMIAAGKIAAHSTLADGHIEIRIPEAPVKHEQNIKRNTRNRAEAALRSGN